MTRADPVISRLPIVVLLPQGRCNSRCLMCDYWRTSHEHRLGPRDLEAMIPAWRALGVQQVVLSGGEPLLHEELAQICALLHHAALPPILLSNGLLLGQRAAELVPHISELVLSLDGPGPVHDSIRGSGSAFQRLAEGVVAARSVDPGQRITARCTVQRANLHRLRQTVTCARELGLDGISFLAADLHRASFNRDHPWDPGRRAQVAPVTEDLRRLEDEIAALVQEHAEDFASGFIAEPPAKLQARLLDYFAAGLGAGPFPPVRCNAPWVSTVIEADGDLRPCFFHPPLGNIHDRPLDAILNSARGLRFRRGLNTASDPICETCVCTLNFKTPSAPGII